MRRSHFSLLASRFVFSFGVLGSLAVALAAAQSPAEVEKHIAAAKVAAGTEHVVGLDSVQRYLTVANECAQAALAGLP